MKENIVTNYIKGSLEELGKVTWLTKKQAIKLTIIVLIFCVVVAVFLGVLDLGFSTLFEYVISLRA